MLLPDDVRYCSQLQQEGIKHKEEKEIRAEKKQISF